jgi:alanine racemase
MNSSGILTIDLAAIQSNWQIVRSQAESDVEVGAVIKANAYGLGAIQVASALHSIGCRTFFFATKEEALEISALFPAGQLGLVVLGGVREGDEALFIEHHLIPVLYSKESVERWISYCAQQRVLAPCILKVDTGMTRLGLSFADLMLLSTGAFSHPYFNPVILMSHMACADEYLHPQNQSQLNDFLKAIEFFKDYFPHVRCSFANSSGVFLGPRWHFDLLRPGAALYGVNPTPHLPNPMKSVVKLSLPILQVKDLSEDVFVGYGASYKAKQGSRLAVVAGGYADGINRTLGVNPVAKLLGEPIEAIGRISMDTTIFDIGKNKLPENEVVGKLIDVIDDEFTLDFLMRRNSSLGYEILTSLGARYKRVYRN